MSVRAYRVIEIKHEDVPSFNLYSNSELVEFLDRHSGLYSQLNDGGGGVVTIDIEALEAALEALELEDDVVEALKQDIEAGKDIGCVEYDCF